MIFYFVKAIKETIRRFDANVNFFNDKRKNKKMTVPAILLIEVNNFIGHLRTKLEIFLLNMFVHFLKHITDNSNGFIKAKQIKFKLRRILGLNIHLSTVAKYRHEYLINSFCRILN